MGTRVYAGPHPESIGVNLLEYIFCKKNATNTKKYHWTQVSMAWVIIRKNVILGVNYSFKCIHVLHPMFRVGVSDRGTPWQKEKLTPLLHGLPEIPALEETMYDFSHITSCKLSDTELMYHQHYAPLLLSCKLVIFFCCPFLHKI